MASNAGTKSQGKKQDTSYSKPNQSRGNRKWATNNNNTVNGRGGNYSGINNNSGSTHQLSNQDGSSPMVDDSELTYHMHDRLLFLLGNLYGCKIQVTVRNGIKYEGLFQGATTEGDLGVSLTFARKIHDPTVDKSKSSVQQPILPALLIFAKDLVEMTALDTDLTGGKLAVQEKDSFKTDTDISGKSEIKERELHKWNPGLPEDSALESLEDEPLEHNTNGSWDQFAANEKLFGLKTDFDEELYTTRLDRSAPGYKDREKWAIEKANEIQRSTTNNPHMLEERNMTTADDSGMDEEDRYGAVVRDNNTGGGASKEKDNVYIPPALRNKQQPAHFANFPPDSPLHKLTTGTLTTASSHLDSSKPTKPINNDENQQQQQQQPKRIEYIIATTFRQFARVEKYKLQAKRQALHKKEQSDRLADLVAFHKSFKLDVPIPPDMLPLLNKGKKSPASNKSSPSSDSQQHQKDKENITKATHDSTDVVATTTKKTTTTITTGFKFNIKASEFKPNPAAAAFVPGGTRDDSAATTFAGRFLKKGGVNDHITIDEIFKAPFIKDKDKNPSSIGPTWPHGSKQYRHQFSQYNPYTEDIFTGYPAPAYGYGYPQYRYHQQYVPGIPVQQQNVSYMSPQFVPNVPITTAPMHPAYSPQMPNVSPRKFGIRSNLISFFINFSLY
ncbi:LsmAD domain-containing protein [Chlamydoabsidia padenii]|nr:LsmAD domain-containing protein [Chlamydoabsidia padenii]